MASLFPWNKAYFFDILSNRKNCDCTSGSVEAASDASLRHNFSASNATKFGNTQWLKRVCHDRPDNQNII